MSATFQTAAGGNQIEGRAATRPGSMRELIPADASPVFWYIHHPSRWQLVNGEWLPALSEMRADPGVNRVDKDGNTDQAELAYRRKGWTIIPWDAEPGGYCVAYEGHRGPVHLSKWERPSVFAGQLTVRADTAGYWAFAKRLLEEGTIRIPDERWIDLIIADQLRKVEELRGKAVTQPASATSLNIEEERLATMYTAKERLLNPPVPKGKR
jgi:hypothetical protein